MGCGLRGFVHNGAAGVTAEIEGAPEAIAAFLERLPRQAPPLARIDGMSCGAVTGSLPAGFEIRPSPAAAGDTALEATLAVGLEVAPDTAPCAACRADYLNPAADNVRQGDQRRRGYPFTNCTHCGPRYTITRALPYDRERTTMAAFRQCPDCQREYDDPGDRRYHAQPNACARCGPQLRLGPYRGAAALQQARALLARGGILAVKNVGGYQLACDARRAEAVERLRQGKRRGRKPLALLARDLDAARRVCGVDEIEQDALESRARPIVLLDRLPGLDAVPCAGVAAAVAPGQPRLGVMLPSSPLQELLLAPPGVPDLVVMTSGNNSAEPMVYSEAQAQQQLAPIADAILEHDRAIHAPVDDSVVFCFDGQARLIRRARGYAPAAIHLPGPGAGAATIFAAGAELKGAFCCLAGQRAYLSPHLGEMDRLEALQRFEQTADHYLELLGVQPQALAYDPHPGYQVSIWARRWALRHGIEHHIAVQHHHAHIAACRAEHGLQGAVLGLAWDGTGYGSDGAIWGGEFLLVDEAGCERLARLRPVRLDGGDHAVRHPWRSAVAYLIATLGVTAATELAPRLWPHLDRRQLHLALQHAARPQAGVPCSAAGRLFDAVAALLGVAPETVSYEGEAAIALENASGGGASVDGYPLPVVAAAAPKVAELDWRPLIAAIVADLRRGGGIASTTIMARRFHRSLVDAITAMSVKLGRERGLGQVCCSGGTFLNRRLLRGLCPRLRQEGFRVWLPAAAPVNDGGLALGQAVVARAQWARQPQTAPQQEDGMEDGMEQEKEPTPCV